LCANSIVGSAQLTVVGGMVVAPPFLLLCSYSNRSRTVNYPDCTIGVKLLKLPFAPVPTQLEKSKGFVVIPAGSEHDREPRRGTLAMHQIPMYLA
jgi:hypothetical protein